MAFAVVRLSSTKMSGAAPVLGARILIFSQVHRVEAMSTPFLLGDSCQKAHLPHFLQLSTKSLKWGSVAGLKQLSAHANQPSWDREPDNAESYF